jgi:hypothetical protein
MKNNIEKYKIIKPNFEKVKFNDAITFSLVYDDKILKVKPYLLSTKGKITRQSSREKFSLNKEIYFIEKLKTR